MYGFEIFKGKSYPLTEKDIQKLSPKNSNEDHIFMRCPKCGQYMNFEGGPTKMIDGQYVCEDCGLDIDEIEAYNVLGDENDSIADEWDLDRKRYYESDQSLYDICNGDW